MKIRRRTLIAAAAVPVLALLLLVLLPLALRGRIAPALQRAAERSVDAHVTWRSAGVSLLRDFPNLTLVMNDVSIAGRDPFEGDTLLAVGRARVVLDLGSVWRSRRGAAVVVRAIEVQQPRVRLITLEDGRSNWQIARGDASGSGGAGADLSLRRLTITEGTFSFDDRRAGTSVTVAGLDHTLSGDFGRQRFTLRSGTTTRSVSARFAGVPWLHDARLSVNADVDADMERREFTLRQNEVRINDLVLNSAGSLSMNDGGGALDISVEAPSTQFADILSLVPVLYARNFDALETSGTMSVHGRVHGAFGGASFPAFEVTARVMDGRFKYPDLPLPARDIAFALSVVNPGGHADSTVVQIEKLHLVLGTDPIEGSLALRTPLSDPHVDVKLAGRLELENVGRTVKLESVQDLRGVVVADAEMRGRQSSIDAGRYDEVHASGAIEVTGFTMTQAGTGRAVMVDHAMVRLTPRHVELSDLRARSGRSDVALTATIDNVLGYALGRDVLRGEARVTSALVDLNEWRSDDEARAVPVPTDIDFNVRAEAGRVLLGTLEMTNARGALHVRERRATLENFRVDVFGGTMAVTGFYETLDPAHPRFDVALGITQFDVPSAFNGLATMRALAPVAAYAKGRMSADVRLAGALGTDMSPVLEVLTGVGNVQTSGIAVEGFPAFERLSERLSMPLLRNPALRDIRSSFEVRDGRLHVKPFDVEAGPATLVVTGSNGFDQSMEYDVTLRVPRTALGAEADRVVASLAAQTTRLGFDPAAASTIGVGVRVTGSVKDPQLSLDLRDAATATAHGIQQALRERAAETVEQRVDSAADAARQRAQAEAQRIIAEAEEQARQIREQARLNAERLRTEAHTRADSLAASATSPAGRIAARAAADRLRREADAQAERAVREADARADALVAEAQRRAEQVRN